MAQAVGKYAAKKMLASQLKQYSKKEPAGQYVSPSCQLLSLQQIPNVSQDPYYEYRTDARTGKKKKYKKQIPSYIPAHDADILASVRKRAYRLDMSLFNFLGIRFGWSSVIGLFPAVGDGIDGAMALMVVRKCNKVEGGLPPAVLIQMLIWVVIDFVIGLVPFVGDLLDASIKANTKNVRILERHLDSKYKPSEVTRRQREEAEEAKQRNQEYHTPAPATVYEDMSDEELPRYSSRTHSPAGAAEPRRPEAARVPVETRPTTQQPMREERRPSKGGWFSSGGAGSGGRNNSRRERPRDEEMGRSGSRREREPVV
jgi:hypothetical protein